VNPCHVLAEVEIRREDGRTKPWWNAMERLVNEARAALAAAPREREGES